MLLPASLSVLLACVTTLPCFFRRFHFLLHEKKIYAREGRGGEKKETSFFCPSPAPLSQFFALALSFAQKTLRKCFLCRQIYYLLVKKLNHQLQISLCHISSIYQTVQGVCSVSWRETQSIIPWTVWWNQANMISLYFKIDLHNLG